jgi:hypothetical protein
LEHIAPATTFYIGLTLFISVLVIYMKRECCASSPKPNEPLQELSSWIRVEWRFQPVATDSHGSIIQGCSNRMMRHIPISKFSIFKLTFEPVLIFSPDLPVLIL